MEVEFCEEWVERLERSEPAVEAVWSGWATSNFRLPETCCRGVKEKCHDLTAVALIRLL